MGWTGQHATHYKKGTVDRKAECDAYFMEGLNAGFYNVLRSALVGSVYYAAVQNVKKYGEKQPDGSYPIEDIPEEERTTWAAVFLTSVNSRDYFNFLYKDLSEDMGPADRQCPMSILKLLSPTDNEYAIEWRKDCYAAIEQKKNPNTLSNLPVGAAIRFTNWKGEVVELTKHPAAYQFKRPFWYNPVSNTYTPAKRIPENYEVISA